MSLNNNPIRHNKHNTYLLSSHSTSNSNFRVNKIKLNLRDFPVQWHKTCIEIASLNLHVASYNNYQAICLLRLPLCCLKQQKETDLKLCKSGDLFKSNIKGAQIN